MANPLVAVDIFDKLQVEEQRLPILPSGAGAGFGGQFDPFRQHKQRNGNILFVAFGVPITKPASKGLGTGCPLHRYFAGLSLKSKTDSRDPFGIVFQSERFARYGSRQRHRRLYDGHRQGELLQACAQGFLGGDIFR